MEIDADDLLFTFLNQNHYSFAFNENATIIFVGLKKGSIKLFGFNTAKKLISILNCQQEVSCVFLMTKSKLLVSGGGGRDKSIAIWSQNQNNLWTPQQILMGHTQQISCMIINKAEDLLISGGSEIKFWRKINLNWICQQTIVVSAYCLSLNISETKLISCGYVSNIQLIEQNPSSQWNFVQIINVDKFGLGLHFIYNDLFVHQPLKKEYLQIYKQQQQQQQFIKVNEIQRQPQNNTIYYYPCQFLEQKNSLTFKNNQEMIFIRIDENGKVMRQQSILFHHHKQGGRLTNDGFFIVSWNGFSLRTEFIKDKCI